MLNMLRYKCSQVKATFDGLSPSGKATHFDCVNCNVGSNPTNPVIK